MAKSFCSGCKYWKRCTIGFEYNDPAFYYSKKFEDFKLSVRKELCGGKYKEGIERVKL